MGGEPSTRVPTLPQRFARDERPLPPIDCPRVKAFEEGSRRTALVHDFLVDLRGADRVFLAICDLWPDADLHAGLRRAGDRGALRPPRHPDLVPPAAAPDAPRTLPRAAAALPDGDRVVRPVRIRPRHLELERVGARGHLRRAHHARVLLLQPVPVRVERPRPDARGAPRPGLARRPARPLPALAPVGLDRRAARGPLHHELADDAGADPQLLRPRVARSSTRRWTPAVPPGRAAASTT